MVIVQKDQVEWSDVLPYFTPSVMIIITFLFYIFTGNLLLLMGMALAYDLYGVFNRSHHLTDNRNLSSKNDRVFFDDKRFWIPLHAYNILETLVWIWQLVLFSDKYKPDWFIFSLKPKTLP